MIKITISINKVIIIIIIIINNGNRTEWSPIRSEIIRVNHKITRPRVGNYDYYNHYNFQKTKKMQFENWQLK